MDAIGSAILTLPRRPSVGSHVSAAWTGGRQSGGCGDTRELLRKFFEVDRAHVTVAALKALADQEVLPAATVGEAIQKLGIDVEGLEPWRA